MNDLTLRQNISFAEKNLKNLKKLYSKKKLEKSPDEPIRILQT